MFLHFVLSRTLRWNNFQDFSMRFEQIQEIIAKIDPVAYGKTRNFLHGDVSRLSPFISRGVISTKQIVQAVLRNGYQSFKHEKWVQQLAWREYFQRVLQHRKDLATLDLRNEQQPLSSGFPSAVWQAATGIHAIDRSINELYETGYIHNHARMYVSSIVTNIAGGDWRAGAKWMYYHLLDADVASNGCSWQWICGSFSSKKYFANQENINKYSGSNQRGTFLDTSYDVLPYLNVPEHLKAFTHLHLQTTLPKSDALNIDPQRPTLIYNFYNLDPLWHADVNVNRILLLEPSHFATYPVSEKTIEFVLALKDHIPGIQVFTGEFEALKDRCTGKFICKEHPLFHYDGAEVEERDWMFPGNNKFYPSFFAFWKKAEKLIGHW